MKKDEYLLVSQVAYLLKEKRTGVDKLLELKKIPYVVRQGHRLIRMSDLKKYVAAKKEKYRLAHSYFDAENKSSFWFDQDANFKNRNMISSDEMEYLTITQVAYLLNLSRQAVHGLVNRGKMKKQNMEMPMRIRPVIFIRADEVEAYVTNREKKFERAAEYFESEDSFAYWETHFVDFERHYTQPNKEINRKYYEKGKIQKDACRSGEVGRERRSQTRAVEGKI